MSSLLSNNNLSVTTVRPLNPLIDPTITMKSSSNVSVSPGNAALQGPKGASARSGIIDIQNGPDGKNLLFLAIIGYLAYRYWR